MRAMTEGDIGFALELTDREEWAYSRNEFERMFRLPHSGCLVWDEGSPSAFVTGVQYGRTAVISHLVVSGESRGRNIGRRLLEASLGELDKLGMESVLLFSTSSGERLYRSLGFCNLRDVVSYGFRVGDDLGGRRCAGVQPEDMEEVCALDSCLFGDDRSLLLNELYAEHPDLCFKTVDGGRVTGFAFGRRTPLGGDIGPWASTSGHDEDASSLLRSVLDGFRGERVDVGFFDDVPLAMSLLDGQRREKEFRVKLMVRGGVRYPAVPQGVLGIAGFELG